MSTLTGPWPMGFIDEASMFFELKSPECIPPRIAPTWTWHGAKAG